jgi:hypothetical protein
MYMLVVAKKGSTYCHMSKIPLVDATKVSLENVHKTPDHDWPEVHTVALPNTPV